ncbi:hypothetical protein [Stenotrophomonas sp. LMG 10879]|nr:hypothetical protein [Stenotrophomonas sp. LMG 10879]
MIDIMVIPSGIDTAPCPLFRNASMAICGMAICAAAKLVVSSLIDEAS